jgi:hypothetical protein
MVLGEDKIKHTFIASAQARLWHVNPTAADTEQSRQTLSHGHILVLDPSASQGQMPWRVEP